MTDKELFNALSQIKDEYILEAAPDNKAAGHTPVRKRRSFRTLAALAAAAFVIIIGLTVYRTAITPLKDADTTAGNNEIMDAAGDDEIMNAAGEEMAEEQWMPDDADEAGYYDGAGEAEKAAPSIEEEAVPEHETETEAETESDPVTGEEMPAGRRGRH